MHKIIYEYAAERLAASGEAETLGQRHADYYLGLAVAPTGSGPQDPAWLGRLAADHAN